MRLSAIKTEEAATCLAEVIRNKLEFRIRSGGLDVNGYSSADDAVVIDLRHLDSVVISDDESQVIVGPAVRFKKLYPALTNQKLLVPAGVCNDVAVGGHALGGGNGYLQRLLGASCDQVVGLKAVDCHGAVIHATAEENPDLFWALRGAWTANFGLVLEYTYSTRKVEKFATLALRWKWEDYDEVFKLWQNWAPFTDTRLTSSFTLYKDEITAMGTFAGPKEADLGVDVYERYDKAMDGLMAHYVASDSSVSHEHSTFAVAEGMGELYDADAMADLEDIVRKSPGTSSIVFFARGGRICGVPFDFNAYRFRSQPMETMIRTTWNTEKDGEACLKWIPDSYSRLKRSFSGVYKSWTYSKVPAGIYDWYGEDIPRLVATKRKFDPENRFHNPQSIPVRITQQQIKDRDGIFRGVSLKLLESRVVWDDAGLEIFEIEG